jgi:hypothetical protein
MAPATIISDAHGITTRQLDDDTEGMAVDSILGSHINRGATAAAFLTARADWVLARALLAAPRNSGLRRASLITVSGETQLGPWLPEL